MNIEKLKRIASDIEANDRHDGPFASSDAVVIRKAIEEIERLRDKVESYPKRN